MADNPASDTRSLLLLGRHIARRIIATGSKVVKILPFFLLQLSSLFLVPTPSLLFDATSRFGSTHLDPFKNAMLESQAPETSLALNRNYSGR